MFFFDCPTSQVSSLSHQAASQFNQLYPYCPPAKVFQGRCGIPIPAVRFVGKKPGDLSFLFYVFIHGSSHQLEFESLNFDFWLASQFLIIFSTTKEQPSTGSFSPENKPRLVVGEEEHGRNLLDDLPHRATSVRLEDHLT